MSGRVGLASDLVGVTLQCSSRSVRRRYRNRAGRQACDRGRGNRLAAVWPSLVDADDQRDASPAIVPMQAYYPDEDRTR
jgi:hypothetical protein